MQTSHVFIFIMFSEKADLMPEAQQDRSFYIYVAGAIIGILLLCLCVGSATFKMWAVRILCLQNMLHNWTWEVTN